MSWVDEGADRLSRSGRQILDPNQTEAAGGKTGKAEERGRRGRGGIKRVRDEWRGKLDRGRGEKTRKAKGREE